MHLSVRKREGQLCGLQPAEEGDARDAFEKLERRTISRILTLSKMKILQVFVVDRREQVECSREI